MKEPERTCLMTFYPTKCTEDCFNCDCGGAESTKNMYVSINDVQRVCSTQGSTANTNEGKYIAKVIRNSLETMVESTNNSINTDTELSKKYNEAIRLLKLAVEDIHELLCDKEDVSQGKGQACNICSYIEWCNCCERCTIRDDLKMWRHSNEVEKLLKED